MLVSSTSRQVLEFGCKYRRHGISPFTRGVSVMRYLAFYEISSKIKLASEAGRLRYDLSITYPMWETKDIDDCIDGALLTFTSSRNNDDDRNSGQTDCARRCSTPCGHFQTYRIISPSMSIHSLLPLSLIFRGQESVHVQFSLIQSRSLCSDICLKQGY